MMASHKMLKGVSKSVSNPLFILMNRSFDEGIFPDICKLWNVIPIFKKGDKSQHLTTDQLHYWAVLENFKKGLFLKRCIIFYYTIISYISIKQISYLTTQQCFSSLASFIIYAKLLIIICSISLYSVTCQKNLIGSGARVFCLSKGKMALRGNFKNG